MKYKVQSFVKVTQDQGECVLLNMKDGNFFGLDQVGSLIWQWIEEEQSTEEMIDRLEVVYQVDRTTLCTDLQTLVQELEQNGLVIRIE